MSLKGRIDPDHIPMNKYELAMVGLTASVTFTKLSGLEQENAVVDLPDRTRAPGGQVSATEIVVEVPAHHSGEITAMDLWWVEGQDPITSTAKKAGTLTYISGTGDIARAYALLGAWVSKRKLPDGDMSDDGNMAVVTYTIQIDSCSRIG